MKKTIKDLSELISNLHIRSIGPKASPEAENLIIDFDLTLPIEEKQIKSLGIIDHKLFRFKGCVFKRRLSFESNDIKFFFFECDFQETGFTDVTFENKIRFQRSRFHYFLKFENTIFKELIDFWNTEFYQRVIFYKSDFESTAVFSATTFYENVLFTYSLFAKQVIFRGAAINKGIDLSLAIHKGSLSVFDFSVADFDSEMKILNKIDYEKSVGELGEIPVKNKRETFRILKRTCENNSDYIHSLDYKKLELKTYKTILNQNRLNNKGWWKNGVDKFTLYLNKISNLYGTRFDRGIFFTLLVGLIFYFFSFIFSKNYSFSLCSDKWELSIFEFYWKNYILFLNPTHGDDLLGNNNTFLFYLFDYLGRIAVGYGIYQTIQAFRKYK